MNYLTSVLALDSASAASFGAPPATDTRTQDGSSGLLAALLHESDYAATMIAVCASITNVLAQPAGSRTALTGNVLTTYAALPMLVFETVAQRLLEEERLAPAAGSYLALSSRLALAQRMSQIYADEMSGAVQKSVDLAALQSAWRHACVAALRLRQDLWAALAEKNVLGQIAGPVASRQRLSCLILAAANGDHPCVDDDGHVSIPGWAERRRHTRHTVDIALELEIGLHAYPVQAFDASTSGFGLQGLPPSNVCELGDLATLYLPKNRRLRGHIAWIAAARAGVMLLEPLAADDPIFEA